MHLVLLSNLYFIPETTISCLTAFMIVSIHLVSAYLWVFTFHFLQNSLEKQLCIDSFSFFPFFKKVLSLWIFSEDVWNWWAVISTLFPRLTWAVESHSCHEYVCWSWYYESSWMQFSTVNTVVLMHLLLSVFPLIIQNISWSTDKPHSSSSTAGKVPY